MQKSINDLLNRDKDLVSKFDYLLKDSLRDKHDKLNLLSKRLEEPMAQVVVAGSFNSGKSEFINSLLKDDVCPVRGNPSTSAITLIKHGPLSIYKIDEDEKRTEISANQYTEMVTHQYTDNGTNTDKRYKFEVKHPAEILRHIILVDTPGFNNSYNPYDDSITKDFVTNADVLLWLNDINVPLRETEFKILKSKAFKDPHGGKYLILTKADLKREPKAREKIRVEMVNDRNVKDLFADTLIYSALEAKKGNGSFKTEINELKDLLIRSGELANVYVQKNFHSMLSSYLIETSAALDRAAEQIPPDESFLSHLIDWKNKLLSSMNEQREEIVSKINELFKGSFDAVEISKNEKSYWLSPYAKIVSNPKKLLDYIRTLFSGYKKRIIEKTIDLNGEGISFNGISFDYDMVIEKMKLQFYERLRKEKFKDSYYDIDDAKKSIASIDDTNWGVLVNEDLNKYIMDQCGLICSHVKSYECKNKKDSLRYIIENRKRRVNRLRRKMDDFYINMEI
jgi:hypothetical protein